MEYFDIVLPWPLPKGLGVYAAHPLGDGTAHCLVTSEQLEAAREAAGAVDVATAYASKRPAHTYRGGDEVVRDDKTSWSARADKCEAILAAVDARKL